MENDLVEFGHSMMWSEDERARNLYRELARDIVSASSRDIGSPMSGRSGRISLDSTLFVGYPTILRRLGTLLAPHVPKGVDRMVTASVPGVALAASVSLACGVPFSVLPQVSETLSSPAWGEASTNGSLAHETVVLIQDIVDTGRHALRALQQVEAAGGRVQCVVAVIDLGCQGEQLLSSVGTTYHALLHRPDLFPILTGER